MNLDKIQKIFCRFPYRNRVVFVDPPLYIGVPSNGVICMTQSDFFASTYFEVIFHIADNQSEMFSDNVSMIKMQMLAEISRSNTHLSSSRCSHISETTCRHTKSHLLLLLDVVALRGCRSTLTACVATLN